METLPLAQGADPKSRAKEIVNFWRRRGWLSGCAPLHVHPLDLDKLEDLIASALTEGRSSAP